ncbi:MAG: FHA domain-containing protein [Myxococcales bacterium]|nr:FHA domain-containing protein [Myxococcales bacterium]
MVPEQIHMEGPGDCNACLVDAWGRVYRLGKITTIGRNTTGCGIAIHQGSVSREHATLEYEDTGTVYFRDLGSTNGSVVANRSVRDSIELVTGDLLFIGSVGFYFVSPAPPLSSSKLSVGTVSASAISETPADMGAADAYERTDIAQPAALDLHTIEATGGGGGFVCVEGKDVQVSMVQLELLQLLMKRMAADQGRPVAVRGYVHSSEILAAVSWDTAHPSDNHVKQLVRRLRRSLARSGRDDLIESQQGLGYRLSVVPRV